MVTVPDGDAALLYLAVIVPLVLANHHEAFRLRDLPRSNGQPNSHYKVSCWPDRAGLSPGSPRPGPADGLCKRPGRDKLVARCLLAGRHCGGASRSSAKVLAADGRAYRNAPSLPPIRAGSTLPRRRRLTFRGVWIRLSNRTG